MNIIYKIILFILASIGIIWISRSSFRNIQHHGFYRFFAWETILVLFLMNMEKWFLKPFSFRQLFSWTFLIVSIVLIYGGVRMFRREGKLDPERDDPSLVGIEKTSELVTTGLYHYIRHPFYSSLLFLGWGIFLKDIHLIGFVLAILTTILLLLTAIKEEAENIHFFGNKYLEYMRQTKRFVPFIF